MSTLLLVPLSCRKERERPSNLTFVSLGLSRPVFLYMRRGPDRANRAAYSVRRQVRAIRVYRVPLLGVHAGGLPGRRRHARTPCPYLAGLFETRIRIGTTRLVALIYPRRVGGCIVRCVRLPYPYVPHLLPPFLVALPYPSVGGGN